jgi:hypothetical protein
MQPGLSKIACQRYRFETDLLPDASQMSPLKTNFKQMKNILVSFILVNSLLNTIPGFSQDLSNTELDSAFKKISILIEENYVFPDKGKKISSQLINEYEDGLFNQVKDWNSFEKEITLYLRKISKDGHLFVKNDPARINELMVAEKKADDSPSQNHEDNPFYYGQDAVEKNFGFREVKILDNNIGYIRLSEVNISSKSLPVLFATMEFVSNTKALILDLRDNGGGGSELGSVIQTFFLPKTLHCLTSKQERELAIMIRLSFGLQKKSTTIHYLLL